MIIVKKNVLHNSLLPVRRITGERKIGRLTPLEIDSKFLAPALKALRNGESKVKVKSKMRKRRRGQK